MSTHIHIHFFPPIRSQSQIQESGGNHTGTTPEHSWSAFRAGTGWWVKRLDGGRVCLNFILLLLLSQIYLRWEERPADTSAQHAIASEFSALWKRIRAGPWWEGVHNGWGRWQWWWQRRWDSPTKTRFRERQDQTPLCVQRDPVSSVKKNVQVPTLASSFPKSFPQSFLSFFLTIHFAYCYYSKATGHYFISFVLGIDIDVRRTLAEVLSFIKK